MKKIIKPQKNKERAFTVLELLVVIAIIGLLSMITLMSLSSATFRGRDTKTIAQLSQIPSRAAIEYASEGNYNSICFDEDNFSITSGLRDIQLELLSRGKTIKCYAEEDNYCISTELNSGEYYLVKNNQKITSSIPCSSATTGGGYWGDFQCGESFTDSRDNKTYTTVLIGTQCWMKENLNVGTMITSCTNGYLGVCTTGGDTVQNQGTSLVSIQKYCYLDSEANCTTSGGLYQWNQIMGGSTTEGVKGICPEGWHIPKDSEIKTLEMYLGMTQVEADKTNAWRGTTEGDKLKKAGLCGGRTPCGTSGFDLLLAGYRLTGGSFLYSGSRGYFWSSLESSGTAFIRHIYSTEARVYRDASNKAFGFSVRCLRDN